MFDEHAATIIGLLDHLGLAEAIIVGHLMGALISLQIASDHPERVSGLLLTNAGAANISASRLRLIVAGQRVFASIFTIPWVRRVVARTRWLHSALLVVAVYEHSSVSTALAMEIIPCMAAPGFTQSLQAAAAAVNGVTPQAVTCPSLVVWGVRDVTRFCRCRQITRWHQ